MNNAKNLVRLIESVNRNKSANEYFGEPNAKVPKRETQTIKSWYKKALPFEDMELPDKLSFKELRSAMEDGKDFYTLFEELGCDVDSIIRENIFSALEELYTDTDYDYWYDLWLKNAR